MSESIRVNSGYKGVELPNGHIYDGPITVTLTDIEFAQISQHSFDSGVLTDLGVIQQIGGVTVTGTPSAGDISALATETTNRTNADSALSTAVGLKAPSASPSLTGTPTAPTASPLDNSTKLATTAYSDLAVGVEKSRALVVRNPVRWLP